MLTTRFTQLVGCAVPIQQAGMGGVAGAGLAASVAQAGALGMLGGVRLTPAFLASVLDRLKQKNYGTIGVNFLVPFIDHACVEAAAARTRVVEFFYGEPDPKLVQKVHAGGALAAWQIGSVKEAQQAQDAGCDFIVAQGIEAGGHVRGKIGLFPLLEQVLDKVTVPVIASGGIGTARSMAAALSAGAEGVRIGTRFVAAAESMAHPTYKEALVKAVPEDTVVTDAFAASWPNAPARVLRSALKNAEAMPRGAPVGETEIGGQKLPVQRLDSPAPLRTTTGKVEAMALYAGESVGAVTGVQPAADIIKELAEGAEYLLTLWAPQGQAQ